jgi:hypothetical protein
MGLNISEIQKSRNALVINSHAPGVKRQLSGRAQSQRVKVSRGIKNVFCPIVTSDPLRPGLSAIASFSRAKQPMLCL